MKFTGNSLRTWPAFAPKPAALQELDLSNNSLQLAALTEHYIRSLPANLALLFNGYHISVRNGVRKLADVTARSSRKPGGTFRSDSVANPSERPIGSSYDRLAYDALVGAARGPTYQRAWSSPTREASAAGAYGKHAAGRKKASKPPEVRQATARSDNRQNDSDATVNQRLDREAASKLHHAVRKKDWAYLMQELTADKSLANAKNDQGFTLLHHAVRENYPELVDHLLQMNGIVVNAEDNARRNPLHYAVMCGDTSLATKLAAAGSKLGQALGNADFQKKTPLHHAAEGNRIDLIELLSSVADNNINEPDNDGNTPLTYALGFQDRRCLKTLLSLPCIDVNAPVRQCNTPLIIAVSNRHTGRATLLLKHENISVNAQNENGSTALHAAVTSNNRRIVSFLAKCSKTDINLTDNNRMTPLHHAIKEGYVEIAAKLVEMQKADVNVPDIMGRTPLHDAVRLGRLDCVELLLRRDDIAVNRQDVNGLTPLHYAAYNETTECGAITLALLSHPAIDADIKNAKGRNAYGTAKHNHNRTFITTYSEWARSRRPGHHAYVSRSRSIPSRR